MDENRNQNSADSKKVDVSANVVRINTTSAGKTVIRPRIVKQVVPPAEGSIDAGEKAAIKEKLQEWVNISGLVGKPLHYGAAYSRLFKQAKSLGAAGAPNIDNYPKADLEKGLKFINQQIAILKRNKRYRDNDPDRYAKDRVKAIRTRIKQNGISDQQYREYLTAVYQVNSINELNPGQLEELYGYTFANNRFLLPKAKEKTLQELREEALRNLVESQGMDTTKVYKDEIFESLRISEKTLFGPIGVDSFNVFWKKQKLYRARTGRKPSNKEA